MLSHLETKELVELPAELRSNRKRVAVLPLGALRLLSRMVDRYQVLGLMRHVRPIVPTGSPDAAVVGGNRGTFRSRLRTLSSAFTSGNFTGLLPILDSVLWERTLERPRSVWNRALVPWGLLFPPGDPDRFRPGHQFRRLLGVSGHAHRARGGVHRC